MNSKQWTITAIVVALLAAGSGVAAWKSILMQLCEGRKRRKRLEKEITYRLGEIERLLNNESMEKGVFYSACMRYEANGVGISEEYKDQKLKSLAFELRQVAPKNKRLTVSRLQSQLADLAEYAPKAPFRDKDIPDVETVDKARREFAGIRTTWNELTGLS